MKVFIATDTKMYIVNNRCYVDNSFLPIIYRYSNYFGKIILCTRIVSTNEKPNFCEEITPYIEKYIGIESLMCVYKKKNIDLIKKEISAVNLVIGRVPSLVSYKVIDIAKKLNKPYLTEAMGCAWDAYWNHSLIGKLIAPYMYVKMRNVIYKANYATYVTEKFLQTRYPCKNNHIHASNVSISSSSQEVIERRLNKIKNMNKKSLVLLTAAGVDVKYKGQEYVIKCIKDLNKYGIDIEYHLVGKGEGRYLKKLCKKYKVEDKVFFHGGISREAVFMMMDNADIYIQPSKQEGLPRAVIEAMSRGCLVLGSDVAGIPELLHSTCIFRRGSSKSIKKAIINLLSLNMEFIAISNFEKSTEFEENVLNKRRKQYYNFIIREI